MEFFLPAVPYRKPSYVICVPLECVSIPHSSGLKLYSTIAGNSGRFEFELKIKTHFSPN